jgi:monoamine oxidase
MTVTRRSVINAVAAFGGAGAVYEALAAWEFLKPPPAFAGGLGLPPQSGTGKSVAILGAGVAGLCAAYELDQAGYEVVVLEASRRPGGRSLTLRRGDTFQEVGQAQQVCSFSDGLYFNAGPGRIPHHHVRVIDYCRRFGVALQPYIFASRANLVHSGHLGNGRTLQVRRALYDLQGHVAGLLAKCAMKPGMDLGVGPADLEKLRDMLATFGDLTKTETNGKTTYRYENRSGRAGFESPPGLAGAPGKPLSPMRLDEILRSQVWNDYIFREADIGWQTSLLEPVGGMDMFFRGFLGQALARRPGTIEGLVRYGAKATGLEVTNDNVRIAFDDGGSEGAFAVDYCISTIPAPVFAALRTNLPERYTAAARKLPVQAAGKVGWEAERFWEREDQIYGGISWTTDAITQVWYPSHGYLSARGTLTGAYMYGAVAERFNAMSVADRLRTAREQGEKLHPKFAGSVEHGVAIGWNNMEFQRFGWANEADPTFEPNARLLSRPQGRFHMAGDQLTYWSGWQEGAILSAWAAVRAVDKLSRG